MAISRLFVAVFAADRPGVFHRMAGSAHAMRIILAKTFNVAGGNGLSFFSVAALALTLHCCLMAFVFERDPIL
jgi:hypothetical protein